MRSHPSFRLLAVSLVLAAVSLGVPTGDVNAQRKGGTTYAYTLTDLPGFVGSAYQTRAEFVLNRVVAGSGADTIDVFGTARVDTPAGTLFHPARWRIDQSGSVAAGDPQDLGLPEWALDVETSAVNSLGRMVGLTRQGIPPAQGGNGSIPSYLFTPGLGYTPISDSSGGFGPVNVDGINDDGVIAGAAGFSLENGALWQTDFAGNVSAPVILPNFIPYAINNHGVMAGTSLGWLAIGWFQNGQLQIRIINSSWRCFGPTVSDLNDRAYDDPLLTVVATSFRNEAGSYSAVDDTRGMIWRPNQTTNGLTILGTLGGNSSYARDVNRAGIVTGYSDTKKSGEQAFVYENGTLKNLNSLANLGTRTLQHAVGINDSGDIVGFMRVPVSGTGEQHGFLLRRNGP